MNPTKLTKDGTPHFRILYWGCAEKQYAFMQWEVDYLQYGRGYDIRSSIPEGGKPYSETQRVISENKFFIQPIVFESEQGKAAFDIVTTGQQTVVGNHQFSTILHHFEDYSKESAEFAREIFPGVDGIVFVVNSLKQTDSKGFKYEKIDRWALTQQEFRTLKEVAGADLIRRIPLVVLLVRPTPPGGPYRSPHPPEVVQVTEFERFLRDEGFWFEPSDPLYAWNPKIFETELPEFGVFRKKDTLAVFLEISRRVGLYAFQGQGQAPPKDPGISFQEAFK